ncbi:MAG: amino acid permease, partial [Bacteroidota bacterium]
MDSNKVFSSLKRTLIGKGRDPHDPSMFHNLSLIAFFAWVGLGSDGISSSCYGPSEIMLTLQGHYHLALIVAVASVITIIIISTSYSQIVELFPSGGGGYLVASKLLSPSLGMVSGCALLIDYVLTITVSVASGVDALFSFLPKEWHIYRLFFAMLCIIVLILLNLRGVKESVMPLVPIFIIFILTHLFAILYSVFTHASTFPTVVAETSSEFSSSLSTLGIFGTLYIIMHAYSMGAGTYTGIEAVSNGIPMLREPKVLTAKRTMRYMAISLSVIAFGLIISYLLFNVKHQPGLTLNAVLFNSMTSAWNSSGGKIFVVVTLLSEAAILLVAAQTGFLDGPRVLSNMALDRWVPTRFASLSDRLVTQNGILLMGIAALLLIFFTNGSVTFLIVLYSINVFITFSLSQLGMVRHWWLVRKKEKKWGKKMIVNGIGLSLTLFILIMVIIVKFNEGGWITIIITGTLVIVVLGVKRHYNNVWKLMKRLDNIVVAIEESEKVRIPKVQKEIVFDKN